MATQTSAYICTCVVIDKFQERACRTDMYMHDGEKRRKIDNNNYYSFVFLCALLATLVISIQQALVGA